MKNLLIGITVIFAGVTTVSAQSETKAFNADGIKVIFKPSVKNIVNVRIYFRAATSDNPPGKAGIENLVLDAAAKCGTQKYSAVAIKDSSDKYDIQMYGSADYDYGYLQVNCIPEYFEEAWGMFTEAVINPIFEANEVELLKNKKIGAAKDALSTPYSELERLQMANAFVNTSYAVDPQGTEESLSKITASDLTEYYKKMLNKNRIFIVVVGKVDKDDLAGKIISAFGNMPAKSYSSPEYTSPIWNDGKVVSKQRALPTNYISAILNAPSMTNVDYVPFRIGMAGLAGNLNGDLHKTMNLSYSQGTETMELKMPYARMYVSTTKPVESMRVMMQDLKDIQNSSMDDEWLGRIKNTFITRSFIDDQSASAITGRLGEAEILGGWQYAEDWPKLVAMVTSEQVNKVMQFYIAGLKWFYLGNTEIIEGAKIPSY